MPSHSQQVIHSLHIDQLKGIKNFDIGFNEVGLTALMGVNGCGKSTIIHALACCYKPINPTYRNYNFSNFFVPNTYATWAGSKLTMCYSYRLGETEYSHAQRVYEKQVDRWTRYESRPERNVIFIGINTCVPDIEKVKYYSRITLHASTEDSELNNIIKNMCGEILEKDYTSYGIYRSSQYKYIGVKCGDTLTYSSLSMGAGEQRVFQIIESVFSAPKYSLILIDEIDLLLHINSLKRLIHVLKKRAIDKNLQIIFTTHSLVMDDLNNEVMIKYIHNQPKKTSTYDGIPSKYIYNMTGEEARPLKVYVEDTLAAAIVKKVSKELNMRKKIEIFLFGSSRNAFTHAASFVMKNEPLENILIVLDGDVYQSRDEQLSQIKVALSGTEDDIASKWDKALSIIKQLRLPESTNYPEKYIHELLLLCSDSYSEIVSMAEEIVGVSDSHRYIYDIVQRVGDEYNLVVDEILSIISQMQETKWRNYTESIREWLRLRADI